MLFKSLGTAALAASSLLLPAATKGPPLTVGGVNTGSVGGILGSVIRQRTPTTVNTSGRAGVQGSTRSKIPPGQLPPAGMCRVWIQGVPPGHQPAVTDCATAQVQAAQTANARVIYGDQQSFPGRGKGSVQRGNRDDDNGVGEDQDDDDNGGVLGGGDDDENDEGRGNTGVLGQIRGRSQSSARVNGGRPSSAGKKNGRGHGGGHGR